MATTARTRRRGPLKGRSIVALGLVVFVVVAGIVVWRRSVGNERAKEIAAVLGDRQTLTSQRAALQRDIRDAQSRRRVVPEAERRLGLRVAPDSQTRFVTDPGK